MPASLKNNLPFVIALLAGICFISFGITGAGFTHYPGDLIDGRFNNYLLEHAYRYFTGQESSFWSAPFMFPEGKVITYSDNLLGSAPFYALFRLFGCSRESAFQAWYLLMAVLNFTACYLLLKYLFKNNYAAAAGAMVFAFSTALHSQMGHAQTFPRYAVPLAFLMGLLFFRELKVKYFFWAVFFVVYQIYCGIYIGFLLAACMGLLFVSGIALNYRSVFQKIKRIEWWTLLFGALIVNTLLLLPLMLPYLERAKDLGYYSYEFVSKSLLTPKSYLFSWVGSLFWDVLSTMCVKDFRYYCDYQVFPGAFATIGLVIFVFSVVVKMTSEKRWGAIAVTSEMKVMALCSVLCWLFFTRFGDFSLYKVIYKLPGFGSMRALQRIINIQLVFYAIAAGFSVNLVLSKKKWNAAFFLLVVAFVIADNYVKPDFRHRHEVAESLARVKPLEEKMKGNGLGKIVSYEPDSVDSSINDFQLDAMLATQSLGMRTLNGYSSTSPPNYAAYWSQPNEANRLIWISAKNIPNDSIFVVK